MGVVLVLTENPFFAFPHSSVSLTAQSPTQLSHLRVHPAYTPTPDERHDKCTPRHVRCTLVERTLYLVSFCDCSVSRSSLGIPSCELVCVVDTLTH